ncbi:SGNH/GDSL hydrolase family protein [Rhodococcus kroppenstedtii]|nr:SGNH/GDSL hydrolase family protein [Rhodococcus kroppenstedtii]MBT1191103.1 SGNH/GDSL hydrolase family protein [Rhodococcus kroppenstedtii]
MIVLSGGSNDRLIPVDLFEDTVRELTNVVRDRAPDVPLVVLSTFYPPRAETLPPEFAAMNSVLADNAARVGATYIDVSNLFFGRPDAIGPDGTHPNDVGQALIADYLTPRLPDPLPRR